MDGWSPIVATASDNDRSSSEGEYMVEPGHEDVTQEAVGKEQRGNVEGMDDGDAAAVGFGISGIGEGKVLMGQKDDRELRYLHLLWEPGRAERTAAAAAAGVPSKLGKITGSRIRRQHRMVRNLCPIGKDIYGNVAVASFASLLFVNTS